MNTSPIRSIRAALFARCVAVLFAPIFAHGEESSPQSPPPYAVQVVGHGSPVYFIPGLGCSSEVWADTVKTLSATHECHLFTLAGFAGLPPTKGEFLPSIETALAAYLQAHASTHPAVVGHSLGGLLALKLSANAPDVVSRLVIVDSLPFYAGTIPGSTPEGARQYAQGLRAALEQQPQQVFLANTRQSLSMLVTSETSQAQVFSWMEKSDQKTVAQAMAAVIATDARAEVARVHCPLLLVEAGAGRGAVPAELYGEQYAPAKALTRVRVADAQHFVMLDQPGRFIGELEKFLSAQP